MKGSNNTIVTVCVYNWKCFQEHLVSQTFAKEPVPSLGHPEMGRGQWQEVVWLGEGWDAVCFSVSLDVAMGVRLHVTKLGKATVVIVFENSSLWVPRGCFWFCLTCFYKFPHQTHLSVLLLHLICTVFVEFSFLKDLVVMIHLLVYHFQNHPCLY